MIVVMKHSNAAFAPKLVSMFREGYSAAQFRTDAIAGLTVAIVALPLSMAIAIASGAPPERGLYTAIIGGFLISAFGGSRHQIGGPAGAFIVLVASVIERHGFDGLLLATIMAGAMMMALGFFKLGTLIKFIPQPVTVGFTAGIAVIIFSSQIRDLLGLTLAGKEPAAFVPKLEALGGALGTLNPSALGLALACIAFILVLKHYKPHWPGLLAAVILSALAVKFFNLPVETIGSRFGGVPSSLPAPAMPPIGLEKIKAIFPDALAIALLGAIESLLSAVVADGMTGRKHRSNTELVAQGVANIGSALFDGICATGTIARTATNVRAGAYGPVAGMLHSVYLLAFMLLLAPYMAMIPLAALGGILAIVAWNMAERHAVVALLQGERGDALVLSATFLLTVFRDLTEGILVGIVLGSILFSVRMAKLVEVQHGAHMGLEDESASSGALAPSDKDDVITYRISGPLFFGSVPQFGDVMGRIGIKPRVFILDMTNVPFVDSSGAQGVAQFIRNAQKSGAKILVSGAKKEIIAGLASAHIGPDDAGFCESIAEARRIAEDA